MYVKSKGLTLNEMITVMDSEESNNVYHTVSCTKFRPATNLFGINALQKKSCSMCKNTVIKKEGMDIYHNIYVTNLKYRKQAASLT